MTIAIPIVTSFNNKGISSAVKEFKNLETNSKRAQFAIKKAAVPAAAALAGLAAAAGKAVKAASDMAEAQSKVNVIFGDGAKDIAAYSKTASDKIGQSKQAVLDAAGTFGTFGKAAGLSGTNLAKFATGFSGLASDLASFNNSSPEEAIAAIGSGLRGEAEPLRRFGILLNDATLKTAAFELGIYDGSGALTDQQKILAAQKVIFEQSTDAQGDFARTSDGLANSQRTLSAKLADTQAAIGKGLLPVVEAVLPFLKTFADWASDNPEKIKIIAGAIGGVAISIVAINTAMALNPISAIAIGIGLVAAAAVIAYKKFETFRTIVDAVFGAFRWWISKVTIPLFQGLLSAATTVFKAIAAIWNNTVGKLAFTIPSWVPLLGGKSFAMPKIGGGDGASGGGASAADFRAFEEAQKNIVAANPEVFSAPPAVAPSAPGKVQNTTAPAMDNTSGNAGGFEQAGIGGIGPFDNLTINVDAGLISSPSTVGADIITAILAAQRDSGVVFAPAGTL